MRGLLRVGAVARSTPAKDAASSCSGSACRRGASARSRCSARHRPRPRACARRRPPAAAPAAPAAPEAAPARARVRGTRVLRRPRASSASCSRTGPRLAGRGGAARLADGGPAHRRRHGARARRRARAGNAAILVQKLASSKGASACSRCSARTRRRRRWGSAFGGRDGRARARGAAAPLAPGELGLELPTGRLRVQFEDVAASGAVRVAGVTTPRRSKGSCSWRRLVSLNGAALAGQGAEAVVGLLGAASGKPRTLVVRRGAPRRAADPPSAAPAVAAATPAAAAPAPAPTPATATAPASAPAPAPPPRAPRPPHRPPRPRRRHAPTTWSRSTRPRASSSSCSTRATGASSCAGCARSPLAGALLAGAR